MDVIARLSSHPDYSANGWCAAANRTLAETQDVSPEYISKSCKKLEALGLMENKPSDAGGVTLRRGTSLWHNEVNGVRTKIIPPKQSSRGIEQSSYPPNKKQGGLNNDYPPLEQSSTFNNTNKDFNNNSSTSFITGGENQNFKSENQKKETTPDSGQPPSYDWNNLRDVLLADEKFMIWAKMTLKLDVKGVEDVILEYIVEQHGRQKGLNSDYKDLKEHIVNWGRIKLRKEKENQKNQSNGNNSNRFRNPKNDGPTAIINRDDPDY